MALLAAREIVDNEGLQGLSTRRVAKKIGYTAATLYNVFENLDDLITQLNVITIDVLYEDLKGMKLPDEPDRALLKLSDGFIAFTREHPNLWNVLFEHHLKSGQVLPDWHFARESNLLSLIEQALAPLFSSNQQRQRLQSAQVLWRSLSGIIFLESSGKLAKTESIEAMTQDLVTNYVAGLRESHRTIP